MIGVLVVIAIVLLFVLRGRHKRVAARTDGLLISREDRTASFARGPRRLRQRGHLALPIVPYVLAPGPMHASASDPLNSRQAHIVLVLFLVWLVGSVAAYWLAWRRDK